MYVRSGGNFVVWVLTSFILTTHGIIDAGDEIHCTISVSGSTDDIISVGDGIHGIISLGDGIDDALKVLNFVWI